MRWSSRDLRPGIHPGDVRAPYAVLLRRWPGAVDRRRPGNYRRRNADRARRIAAARIGPGNLLPPDRPRNKLGGPLDRIPRRPPRERKRLLYLAPLRLRWPHAQPASAGPPHRTGAQPARCWTSWNPTLDAPGGGSTARRSISGSTFARAAARGRHCTGTSASGPEGQNPRSTGFQPVSGQRRQDARAASAVGERPEMVLCYSITICPQRTCAFARIKPGLFTDRKCARTRLSVCEAHPRLSRPRPTLPA